MIRTTHAGREADLSADCAPFGHVYELHANAIYRFCLSQVGDASSAEDLAADAFTAAFAAYERVRPPADQVRPWLFRIARNAAIDHHRSIARRLRLIGALRAREVATADVETTASLRDDLRTVLAEFSRLRKGDQIVVGLRVAGGLSYADIGAVTGVSEHAAKMAVHRALGRLRSNAGGGQ